MRIKTLPILLSLFIFVSCSSVRTFKTKSDIEDIKELTKHQFISYLAENSPSYLKDDLCKNVFQPGTMDLLLNRVEFLACISPLLQGIDIHDREVPYDDISKNSTMASNAYYLSSINILRAKSPYEYGSNESISGKELISALESILNLKK